MRHLLLDGITACMSSCMHVVRDTQPHTGSVRVVRHVLCNLCMFGPGVFGSKVMSVLWYVCRSPRPIHFD